MRVVPDSIKSEILKLYLEGLSIPEIHRIRGTSVGKISTFTSEAYRKDESFLYMRQIARMFYTKNWLFPM